MKYRFYVKKVKFKDGFLSSLFVLSDDMYLISLELDKEFNSSNELLNYLENETLKITGIHQPVYRVTYYDEIFHRYESIYTLFNPRLYNITVYSSYYEKSFLYDSQDEIYKKFVTISLPSFKHNYISEVEKELRKNLLIVYNTMFYEIYNTIYNFTEVGDV